MSLNYTDIVAMIMRGEPLQTVLDAMAEHLQASVVITNNKMEIIAFSKNVPVRDPYWIRAFSEGRCSEEMLSKIYNTSPARNIVRSSAILTGFSYSPDHATLKYYVSLPGEVFHHDTALIAFPLENTFEKRRQDLILSFACLIKNTYFRPEDMPLAYVYQGHKGIIQRLLNPDFEQWLRVGMDAHTANDASFFEEIQVLVLSPKFQEITDMLLYSLSDAVCSFLNNDYVTVYNGAIVAIFQPQKMTEAETEHCVEQLIWLAEESNATIGISWKFSGMEKFRRHYKQATFSIEMARKLSLPGRIFTYDDMYIYSLSDRCQKQEHWAGIEHPVLTVLKEYDTAHDSCLYDTLDCLLRCGMNSQLTAKKLGIHKSSLYHRIEVLKELIPGLLTKNAEWQTSVMLAFDLARLNQL